MNNKKIEITQGTVNIKILSVGNKHMTLAVFRQIDIANVIDYGSLSLRGEVWGRVNYHPDRCDGDLEHVHVVWQDKESIKRSTIYSSFSGGRFGRKEYRILCSLGTALFSKALFNAEGEEFDRLKEIAKSGMAPWKINDLTLPLTLNTSVVNLFWTLDRKTDFMYEQIGIEMNNWLDKTGATVENIDQKFTSAAERYIKYKTFHDNTYEDMEELDLLFIAV